MSLIKYFLVSQKYFCRVLCGAATRHTVTLQHEADIQTVFTPPSSQFIVPVTQPRAVRAQQDLGRTWLRKKENSWYLFDYIWLKVIHRLYKSLQRIQFHLVCLFCLLQCKINRQVLILYIIYLILFQGSQYNKYGQMDILDCCPRQNMSCMLCVVYAWRRLW